VISDWQRRTAAPMLGAAVLALFVTSRYAAVAAAQTGDTAAMGASYDSSVFAATEWREIGPWLGGRAVTVAGSASRPYEYYTGTTGGGVFKTVNGGQTWFPVTDRYFGGTIGAIAVSESNPDIVYVGTGEYDFRGNVSHGDGMFKSTDAGKTWRFIGLGNSRQIARVRIDPHDPDIVYVGVQGHVWGPNSERGVYKTTDGGKSWKRVLFRNDSTGVTDLVLDPSNSNVIYAAFWQANRMPWKLVSGGAGSGIFKSTDAGEHWTEITRNKGLPSGLIGNIGLAVSPVSHNRVWALVEADSGGLFRSDDAGATWAKINTGAELRQRAWYFARIAADPRDSNTVYAMNVDFFRSTDGGQTFSTVATPHGDNHDLWIAPNDTRRMVEANDGGATVSIDWGRTWTPETLPTGQFYHVTTTTDFPYRVCGAQQDRTTLCGPSRADGGIELGDWYGVGGGESAYIAVRPDSPNVVFAGSPGTFTRTDLRTHAVRDINIWPDNSTGHSANDVRYRFQWTYPIVLSPHHPGTLYAAAQVLFRSTNDGHSWTVISPDLTRHDPRTLGPSGGPINQDQTSVEFYGTIFAVAESPIADGEIWAGSDDGLIHITRNGGRSWQDVTPPGIPKWMRISIIEPSHFDPGTAYVAANHYQMDDNHPYLYRTTDYGKTWTLIVTGIPSTEFTRVIREDPARRGLLYAGTERGVYVSFDDGDHWQSLQRNLPPVPVHDLAVTDGDLVAATHGRGFWILDDLSVLRQATPSVFRSEAHLFTPRRVYRVSFRGGGGASSGTNPPSGAVIYYWLRAPNQAVTVDILDAHGAVIRSFSSQARPSSDESDRDEAAPAISNHAGMNRFVWNLRYPDAVGFPGMVLWDGNARGPIVVPGTYRVRMTVGTHSETRSLVVTPDPRVSTTTEQYAAQFRLLMDIRDTVSAANTAILTIRSVASALADRATRMPQAQKATFQNMSRTLADSLHHVEARIYQVHAVANRDLLHYPVLLNDKLALLGRGVARSDVGPTEQSYAVYRELSAQLNTELDAVKSALRELVPINALLNSAGLPTIQP
jgi:photosystem II stability/assembly factor-like uncharacterized protein